MSLAGVLLEIAAFIVPAALGGLAALIYALAARSHARQTPNWASQPASFRQQMKLRDKVETCLGYGFVAGLVAAAAVMLTRLFLFT